MENRLSSNELRIGNYIYFDKVPCQIHLSDFDNCDEIMNQMDEDYQPIPLSEQWLKDFGFEYNDYQEWIKPDIKIETVDYPFHFDYDDPRFKQMYCTVEIEYVHQLQNLYFALTGKELKRDGK